MPEPLLTVRAVSAGYGHQQVLFDLDLDLISGETTVLLGANGSGKSTLLNVLAGFVRPWSGSVRLGDADITGLPVHRTVRRGIIQVSQARDLFPDMTVEENLRLGAWARPGPLPERLDRIYASFPRLAERRTQPVRQMSGGEQQMVAIGRALMSEPRVLLLDEPSGGLAPNFVREIGTILNRLKADAVSMILVEQNIRFALDVADQLLILRDGRLQQRTDLRGAAVPEDQIVRQIYRLTAMVSGSVIRAFLLAFPALFSIINPFVGALIFHEATADLAPEQRARVATKVGIYSLMVMVLALWTGSYVLAFFGISINALRIAGGVVIALFGWELLKAPEQSEARKRNHARPGVSDDLAFFPLTLPITTGPGTISVVIALGAARPDNLSGALLFFTGASVAALAMAVVVATLYHWADRLADLLGRNGERILTRLSAFLLLCIGVQILITGFIGVLTPLMRP